METNTQTKEKYKVVIEREGVKYVSPSSHIIQWNVGWTYDAFLFPKSQDEKGIHFVHMVARSLDGHILLEKGHLLDLTFRDEQGCLVPAPFGIICIPPEDPLKGILAADNKLRSSLLGIVYSTIKKWYDVNPEDIEINQTYLE